MKKQKIQLIIILVLLLIFAGSYLGLKQYNKVQDKKDSTDTYTALTLDKSAITGMKITMASGETDLVKKADAWVLSSDEAQKIDQDTVSTMLEDIEKITANNKIDNVSNFDQYGLKTPAIVVTITTSDGKQNIVNIGDYSDSTSRYYCRIGNDTTVYLVSSDLHTAFNKSQTDLIVKNSADSADVSSSEMIGSTIAATAASSSLTNQVSSAATTESSAAAAGASTGSSD